MSFYSYSSLNSLKTRSIIHDEPQLLVTTQRDLAMQVPASSFRTADQCGLPGCNTGV